MSEYGLMTKIPAACTDTSLPILYADPIIGAGAMALIDLGHSQGAYSGVPVDTSAIPNVAWETANDNLLSGASTEAALAAVISANYASGSASFPLIERTPKLGLHVIKSQTNDITSAIYTLTLPAALLSYIQANTDHAYYLSIWDTVTRAGIVGNYAGLVCIGATTSSGIIVVQYGASTSASILIPNSTTAIAKTMSRLYTATGSGLLQAGCTGITGTVSSWKNYLYLFGGSGGPFTALHLGASQILYRLYLEDLTVSAAAGGYAGGDAITVAERYTEVAAKDVIMQAAAFSSGGKFYGDTYTAPSGYA